MTERGIAVEKIMHTRYRAILHAYYSANAVTVGIENIVRSEIPLIFRVDPLYQSVLQVLSQGIAHTRKGSKPPHPI